MSTQQFAAVLAGIWERSKPTINDQLTSLEQASAVVTQGVLDDATRQRAERDAHKLAGSVGTFGFTEGTRLAREIERLFQSGLPPGHADASRLAQLVTALRQELSRTPGGQQETPLSPPPEPGSLLLAIDNDVVFLEQVALAASLWGIQVHIASTVSVARQELAHLRPDVVLLSVETPASPEEIVVLLNELAQQAPVLPIVLLGPEPQVMEQLGITPAERQTFVQTPVAPARLLDVILQMSQHPRNTSTRVLLVTDDRQATTALQHYLAAHQEIRLTTLDTAERFWQVFTDTGPDLLILDTTMLSLPGLALCHMIRCTSQWATIPIIVLTANTEVDAVEQALSAGADDYVGKPITGQDLAVRITHRLARSRQFVALLETDLATGLATRRKAVPIMHQLLYLATRNNQPFTVASLTLDQFTRLSSRHGRTGSSAVLRFLGTFLAQAFRKSDIVARWDDETFVIGLYGMQREDGVHRLAETLETFRQHTFVGRNATPFQVTFSVGVATSPQHGVDVESLRVASVQALSQAKSNGGDRVLAVGPQTDQPHDPQSADIVLIDDDEAFAHSVLQAFKTRGYQAIWLSDGQAALAALGSLTPSLTTRLILLNIDLAEVDGLTVMRRLSHDGLLQHTRVIALTRQATEREILAALDLGAMDHLAKPVSLALLMQRVRHALSM